MAPFLGLFRGLWIHNSSSSVLSELPPCQPFQQFRRGGEGSAPQAIERVLEIDQAACRGPVQKSPRAQHAGPALDRGFAPLGAPRRRLIQTGRQGGLARAGLTRYIINE